MHSLFVHLTHHHSFSLKKRSGVGKSYHMSLHCSRFIHPHNILAEVHGKQLIHFVYKLTVTQFKKCTIFIIGFILLYADLNIKKDLLTPLLINTAIAAEPPFVLPEAQKLNRLRSALIQTSKGTMIFELWPELAPWHIANLKYLADKGFFNGKRFSLYYAGYIIIGGDSERSLGYSLPPEFNTRKHEKGVIGMARKKDFLNPERRSDPAQFYLVVGNATNMDGNYTTFGKIVYGHEVLSKLRFNDRIEKFIVYVRK
jgi:cyclophilin family peptidyl-prolyl cis-trans isomerase